MNDHKENKISEIKQTQDKDLKKNRKTNVSLDDIKIGTARRELTDEMVDDLNKVMEFTLNEAKLTSLNMLIVVSALMECAANFDELTGRQKKSIVLTFLRLYLKNNPDESQDTELLLTLLDGMVTNAIDVMYLISKKKGIFDKVRKICLCF
jgi:hypothetical protein